LETEEDLHPGLRDPQLTEQLAEITRELLVTWLPRLADDVRGVAGIPRFAHIRTFASFGSLTYVPSPTRD
jgi:hypothetical protein